MEIIILLSFITIIITLFSFIAFLYVRTNLPDHIENKINRAIEEAENQENDTNNITQEEAINKLKQRYIDGEITDEELDKSIDDVLNNDNKNNKKVIFQYN